MTKTTTLLIVLLSITNLFAQHNITRQRNQFRSGDKIIKQQVEYIDPGRSGKRIVWDFSSLNPYNENYGLTYYSKTEGDTAHFVGIEHDTRYDYTYSRDTLWLTGYENRTTQMEFIRPEAQLRFPFQFGDSLYSSYTGKGLYGGKIVMHAAGNSVATVDGSGKLLLPESIELNNVVRVKRLRNYTEASKDSARIRLETYSWFALGYRYPVFETVKTYILRGDSATEHFATSFYFPIKNLRELADDPLNSLLQQKAPNDYLLSCKTYPNPVENELTVYYELSQDARVSFRLCDVSGRPWVSLPERSLSVGNQQQTISMGGYPKGDYALYIMVDGYVHREKVIKR